MPCITCRVPFAEGDDVLVKISGGVFRGEVLKTERSGFVVCRVHTDPEWDYGSSSARVMPEQIVAVRVNYVRHFTDKDVVSQV
jgi:hypothetical protein